MRKKIIILLSVIMILLVGGCSSNKNVQTTSKESTETISSIPKISDTEDYMLDKYMTANGISLKAKDVQFDMANNLDKKFAIQGIASLGDYYNYGFTDDKNYFCIRVGYDNTVSNSWYLYLNRTSFAELFNDLKSGNKFITATCKIPKVNYKTGQGNLARCMDAEW